jgi:1-deoxy-D-xylulose-5-phosphate reductoisomerase
VPAVRRLAILGSTGSIGRSALSVVEAHRDRLAVVAMAAGDNVSLFAEQVQAFRPRAVSMASGQALDRLRRHGGDWRAAIVGHGSDGLIALATHPDVDMVLCASSGTAALEAVLAAIEAGKAIALANKEVLAVAPTDALKHPTWRMGRKITIDSATLINKGLEVIEASYLFDVPPDRIDIVVHPQSVVHSMVEMVDGSILAQCGVTDMRLPIQYAFSYPERWASPLPHLDLARCGRLDFCPPDYEKFPGPRLAYRALETGGGLPVVLNAANEVAVEEFLAGRLGFTSIPRLIERAMDAHTPAAVNSLGEVRRLDQWARSYSQELSRTLQSKD